ncbi:MAG TPA: PQQ-dependent sugar dehydrogenase [Actinomycetaceae bacterium]|nr:PQQ-dependent sugar dehydrogenase [Actinomycetaceae bacterium]
MKRYHSSAFAVVAAGAALALLAGCAGTGTSDESTTPEPAPTAAATSTPDATDSIADPAPITSPDPTDAALPAPDPLVGTDFATGLVSPWGIDQFEDGTLIVTERNPGRFLRIDEGQATEILQIDVTHRSEDGLLGVTIGPDEQHIYAYYTGSDGNQLVRFPWDGDALGAEEVLIEGIPGAQIHDGGQVRFGPDGHLYISTGDAGDPELAQDPESLAGKILRLTEEGAPAPGNPFDNEVYSMGHRNVQGLAWDDDGNLWASEFGANSWDELNLVVEGGNYGWPEVEGMGDGDGRFLEPAHVWRTGDASPSGLAYWRGSLWMTALRGQRLWQIPVDGGAAGEPIEHWTGEHGRLRAILATNDGELLVGTSNTDGRGNVRDGDDRLLAVGDQ